MEINNTQKLFLKNIAYKNLISFQEGFKFLSDESTKIFFDSENYDSEIIDWAIELIDRLLFKIRNAKELLQDI